MSQLPRQTNRPTFDETSVNASNSSVQRYDAQPDDSSESIPRSAQVNLVLQSTPSTMLCSSCCRSSSPPILPSPSSTRFNRQASRSVRKRCASVWNHFKRVYFNEAINIGHIKPTANDAFTAVCQERYESGRRCTFAPHSGKLLKGSTNALINHLVSSHSYVRRGHKAYDSESHITILVPLKPKRKLRDTNKVLIALIGESDWQFTVSQAQIFKEIVKVCAHDGILTRTLAAQLRTKHQTILSEIQIKLEKSCETIALTLGRWTSPDGGGILAISGTWLDENFNFNSQLLYFNKIHCAHSDEHVASVVFSTLVNFNLCEKLISVSVDNLPNNSTLCFQLEILLLDWASTNDATVKFSAKNRVISLARIINSICQDMVQVMNNDVPYLSELTQSITETLQNTSTLQLLKERGDIQIIRDLIHWINQSPSRKAHWDTLSSEWLDCDDVTRKNSTRIMLSEALNLRDPLSTFVQACREVEPFTLDDDFWNRITNITNVLHTFEVVVEGVSNDESSLLYGLSFYNLLEKRLSFIRQREEMGSILYQAALKGQEVLETYTRLVKEADIYYISSILNPAKKMEYILHDKYDGDRIVEKVQQILMGTYPELPASVELQEPLCPLAQCEKEIEKIWDDDLETSDNLKLSDDIEQYFKNPAVYVEGSGDTEKSIRYWWNANKELYPRMALVARDHLCIPLCAVDFEPLFSKVRDLIRFENGALTPETLNALMIFRSL